MDGPGSSQKDGHRRDADPHADVVAFNDGGNFYERLRAKLLESATSPIPTTDSLRHTHQIPLPMLDATGKVLPPDYAGKKVEYNTQHGIYDKEADAYWARVDAAKTANPRSYIKAPDFPLVYTGPSEPELPPGFQKPPTNKPAEAPLPSLNEIIASSKHLKQFASGDPKAADFSLRQVDEHDFKARYVTEALKIGNQNGLNDAVTADIVKRIYAFEDGGWGTHETFSSMPESMTIPDAAGQHTIKDKRFDYHPSGPSASTAIGYNQLLMMNTVGNVLDKSKPIADRLRELAKGDPARSQDLTDKAQMVEQLSKVLKKELLTMASEELNKPGNDKAKKNYFNKDGSPSETLLGDFSHSDAPTSIGISRRDLARGIHALNLDGDIGPIIQSRELGNVISYAQKHDFGTLLDTKAAAHAQIVADYDKLGAQAKDKAVTELMDLIKPSADVSADPAKLQQFNQTKQSIDAKLRQLQSGADPKLLPANLSQAERDMINDLSSKQRTGEIKPLSGETGVAKPVGLPVEACQLLDKIVYSYNGGLTGDKLMPAALELGNLAGMGRGLAMIDPKIADALTVNFFARNGYEHNRIAANRTADDLLMQINRIMHGVNADPTRRAGEADFDKIFKNP